MHIIQIFIGSFAMKGSILFGDICIANLYSQVMLKLLWQIERSLNFDKEEHLYFPVYYLFSAWKVTVLH